MEDIKELMNQIWRLQKTMLSKQVNKAIEYICNPDKTDENIYISAFACAAKTASYNLKYALDHANDFNSIEKVQKEIQAFYLIQAFEPGA
jgi:DNA-directed RNA polymerase subunit F